VYHATAAFRSISSVLPLTSTANPVRIEAVRIFEGQSGSRLQSYEFWVAILKLRGAGNVASQFADVMALARTHRICHEERV
jgi:hypothetical protein